MFFSIEEIAEYRAGWLETHPDEILDTDTVVKCLHDENEAMIKALSEHYYNCLTREQWFDIIRTGFEGFDNMTHTQLWDEMNTLGLTL